MPRGCRICRFFEKYPYKRNDKTFFETKARQGASLRKLELLLESYGLKARKDLINKHLKECLGFETERKIEREAKKSRGVRGIPKKVKKFFIRHSEVIPQGCLHTVTVPFFDVASEQVYVRCKMCGEILKGSIDPHEAEKRQEKDPRNWKIYESLRRRRP